MSVSLISPFYDNYVSCRLGAKHKSDKQKILMGLKWNEHVNEIKNKSHVNRVNNIKMSLLIL